MLYLVDKDAVRLTQDVHAVTGPVRKLGVLVDCDRPTDYQYIATFDSSIVPLDGGGYRMYYSVYRDEPMLMCVAVAESSDGLQWTKPDLGLVQVDGRDTNRILMRGLPEAITVWSAPQIHRLADGRWRMYFWAWGGSYGRHVVAESADGLTWDLLDFEKPILRYATDIGQWAKKAGIPVDTVTEPVPGGHPGGEPTPAERLRMKSLRSIDSTYIHRDPDTGGYVMYSVWPVPNTEGGPRWVPADNIPHSIRTIQRRTSPDGLAWSDPELVLFPDARDQIDDQFYYLCEHRQDGVRFGLMGHFHVIDGTMDICACLSHDGRTWQRPTNASLIPRGAPGEQDGLQVYPGDLIPIGDDWLMPYTGHQFTHHRYASMDGHRSVVLGARFGRRRFLGLEAKRGVPGHLLTRPFILNGSRIRLDAAARGQIRAELCDAFGVPLAGFTKLQSIPVIGDSPRHELRWEGDDAGRYQHDAVSLRLEVDGGTVYALYWE